MDLADKVAVVTGGGSGIGAACCRAFAGAGARVAVVDRNGDGARAVAGEIGGLAVPADISVEAEVRALVERVTAELGADRRVLQQRRRSPLAAIRSRRRSTSGSEQWEINLMSHVYAVRAVLPGMLERGSGYLLHTASMAGILTSQGNCTYAVTKHAVVGPRRVAVDHLPRPGHPGVAAGPARRAHADAGRPDHEPAGEALGPIKEPEEVAQMVVDAIGEERFLILTDPIAQKWMERKTKDTERWLEGMRRLQAKLDASR